MKRLTCLFLLLATWLPAAQQDLDFVTPDNVFQGFTKIQANFDDIYDTKLAGSGLSTTLDSYYANVYWRIDWTVDQGATNINAANLPAVYLQDITGEALSDLADVSLSGITSGELLGWNGSTWLNQTLVEMGIGSLGAVQTNANDIDTVEATQTVHGTAILNLQQGYIETVNVSSSRNLASTDLGKRLLVDTSGGDVTITINTDLSSYLGKGCYFQLSDASNSLIIAEGTSVTLTGTATLSVTGQRIWLEQSTTANSWDVWGNEGIDASQVSNLPETFVIACSDETSNLTTGTAKVSFRMPFAMTLTQVRASVNTAPTGSVLTVDINEGGASVLSTLLTIDASETTSTTAATAAVISDTSLADDGLITIDLDGVGSTVAGTGLKVTLIGTR